MKYSVLCTSITIAIAGMIAGCNSDGNDNKQKSELKDDAYYNKIASDLVGKMSLDEKISLLAGPGAIDGVDVPAVPYNLKGQDNIGVAGYINGVLNEKTGIDIPATKLADGPAGVRIPIKRTGESGTYYATAWPIATQLASTWNTELVKEVAESFGDEAKEYGIDMMLAPGMNIQKNPRNGRNFEYYSEDPVVTGLMASAMINGMQEYVGTTVKHFAANNSATNGLNINSVVTPRALREIYLRGFEIAIKEGKPWAIMSSYNKINGTYSTEYKDLLVDVLRNEWGFNGIAMSDWNAGNSFKTPYKLINSGEDLIEPGATPLDRNSNGYVESLLKEEAASGELNQDSVNAAAKHIVSQVLKTPSYNNYKYSNNPDLNTHALLSRKAGSEGMVLLKNDNESLPISKDAKVALFGINQIVTYKGGTGSGNVNSQYIVDIVSGLKGKFSLDSDLSSYYQTYFDTNKVESSGDAFTAVKTYSCDEPSTNDAAELASLVTQSADKDDIAVISIGRVAGEGVEREINDDYYLTDKENALINTVSNAFKAKGKKVVFVLNVSGVIDTDRWNDKADAILLAYMGGQDVGNQVADVLSGDVNPSGKLTQTFPKSYEDVPSSSEYPGTDVDGDGNPDNLYYNEGIYVGYRYYTTLDLKQKVSYPFGWGLSYTTFDYSDPVVVNNTLNSKGKNGDVIITAKITNIGNIPGKEAAQLYISAPDGKLKKPVIELKSFAKTNELIAGDSQELTFKVPAYILASFDETHNQWIVEPGKYKAYISSSSDVSSAISITFDVNNEIVTENTTPGALALPSNLTNADVLSDSIESIQ